MVDYQNCSSGFVNSVQKRDEQTMHSLQPRNQVVDKRAEPDDERAADSSMVRCRSDHLDEFIVSLYDLNEEITEQLHDGLHDWYTCRDDQCSATPDRVSSGVSQRRRSSNFCQCLKRCAVSARTNSQISTCHHAKMYSTNRTRISGISRAQAWWAKLHRRPM